MSRSSAAAFDYAPANDSSNDESSAPTAPPSWAEDKNPTRPLPTFRLEEEARRLDRVAVANARASARCDEDMTVTVSAEDNKKLLASVFAAVPGVNQDVIETLPAPVDDFDDHPANNEEPTLDAPAPSSPEAIAALSSPRTVHVTARPPALKMLVITRPAPKSSPRPDVAPVAVISQSAVTGSSPNAATASQPATAPLAFPRTAPSLIMALSASVSSPAPVAFIAPPASGFRPKITAELARTARGLREAEDRRRKQEATFTIRLPKRNLQTYVVAGIWAMALLLFAVLMFMATSA